MSIAGLLCIYLLLAFAVIGIFYCWIYSGTDENVITEEAKRDAEKLLKADEWRFRCGPYDH